VVERRPSTTWVLAARPRTLTAAVVPVLIGSAAAFYDGVFDWRAFLLALVGALAIQVAANFANDASDAARGADTDRVGPQRMVASGLVSSRSMWTAAWIAVAIAVACGVGLLLLAGPIVIVIGVASILAMLGYVGGPLPYGYRGLGEVFVFLFFGLVATGGSRLVHDGQAPLWVWGLGVPVGFLAAAILVANNLRDIPTDTRSGKRTLAVFLGPKQTQTLYAILVPGALALTAGMAAFRLTPWPSVAGLLAAPLIPTLIRSARQGDGSSLQRLLGGTARLHLTYGVLVAAGLAVAVAFRQP
jgi:1,4-dihydroxy-2-naphthoate octaprenyltransferase